MWQRRLSGLQNLKYLHSRLPVPKLGFKAVGGRKGLGRISEEGLSFFGGDAVSKASVGHGLPIRQGTQTEPSHAPLMRRVAPPAGPGQHPVRTESSYGLCQQQYRRGPL